MPNVFSKFSREINNEDIENNKKEEKLRKELLESILKQDKKGINVRDDKGYTPLMLLCQIYPWEYENIKLLLDNGACPNIPDLNGIIPYLILKEKGYDHTCELLLEYGSKRKKINEYTSSSSSKYFPIAGTEQADDSQKISGPYSTQDFEKILRKYNVKNIDSIIRSYKQKINTFTK